MEKYSKEVEIMRDWAEYYQSIDFPNLAHRFTNAANTIEELMREYAELKEKIEKNDKD